MASFEEIKKEACFQFKEFVDDLEANKEELDLKYIKLTNFAKAGKGLKVIVEIDWDKIKEDSK